MKRIVFVVANLSIVGIFFTVPVWAQDGKQVYEKNCVACHGAAGKGDGPAAKAMKTKPQDFAVGLKGKSDADLTKILKEGVVGAEGKATHPKMTKLSDEQLKGVIEYVKQFAK